MPRDEAEYQRMFQTFNQERGGDAARIRRKTKSKQVKPQLSAEDTFAAAWAETGGPEPVRQHKFHDTRGWSFDFAWPAQRLALELEGFGMDGGGGRHHLPAGIIADAEKFNTALLLGWRVLRVPSRGGRDVAQWIELVQAALKMDT